MLGSGLEPLELIHARSTALATLRGSSKTSFYVLQESEFLCLEFDEVKINQVLKKLSEIEESISTLMQPA